MTYSYCCGMCYHIFDRQVRLEHRDLPQVCDCCGCGGFRFFVPSMVNVPEGFAQWDRKDFDMTLEECHAQEEKNEAYLASKPRENPSFEACLKRELDDRGIRRPNRLIDPAAGFDKKCLDTPL